MIVVSGAHPEGMELYGRRFLDTFAEYWPDEVGLAFYTEEPVDVPRGECRSLWDCAGVREFIARHKDIPLHNGLVPTTAWVQADRKAGYLFRFDAVKFCKQLFAPWHASLSLPDGELLCWLDGDVVTHAPVPHGLLDDLIGSADVSYLGRKEAHPEIGYWSVRLGPGTRAFLADIVGLYRTDALFSLREWHSAFAWQHCLARFVAAGGVARNLTPDCPGGHVWHECAPLCAVTDHLKGGRKTLGRSPERASE